ncbi:MAG: hypothetical protein LUF04_00325 [Bacteroides sp.]|nr:hypothetical protein [Bacteroides sp.]
MKKQSDKLISTDQKTVECFSTPKRTIKLGVDGEEKRITIYFSEKAESRFRRKLRVNNFTFKRKGEYWEGYKTDIRLNKVREIINEIVEEDFKTI